ncbi:phosphotransferase [bacterium]|nr:phosphotransferase [candidate division CSSED10-310 bacterium]
MRTDDLDKIRTITGRHDLRLVPLTDGASLRRFFRLEAEELVHGASSVVIMIGDDLRNVGIYHATQRFLLEHGMPVPEPFVFDPAAGLIVMEDLGGTSVEKLFSGLDENSRCMLYKRVLNLLAALAELSPEPETPAHWLYFDREKFIYEFHFHVRRCLLEGWAGFELKAVASRVLEDFFERVAAELEQPPWVLTHRDFQSSNLMIDGDGWLRLIDFQDSRTGPPQYDLASLLYDSYVTLSGSDREWMVRHYRALRPDHDPDFDRRLLLTIVQRKLHDAGAFAFAAMNGKPRFLTYIPAAVHTAVTILASFPEFAAARDIIATATADPKPAVPKPVDPKPTPRRET